MKNRKHLTQSDSELRFILCLVFIGLPITIIGACIGQILYMGLANWQHQMAIELLAIIGQGV